MHTILYEEGFPAALRETYLAQIYGLIGSKQYQKLFVLHPDGTTEDAIRNGDLACAYVASGPLTLCALTKGGVHTTVDELEADLKRSGWKLIEEPIPDAVVIWKSKMGTDGSPHRHIGFALGRHGAVSNDPKRGVPAKHHITFGDTRAIEKIYYHPKLDGR